MLSVAFIYLSVAHWSIPHHRPNKRSALITDGTLSNRKLCDNAGMFEAYHRQPCYHMYFSFPFDMYLSTRGYIMTDLVSCLQVSGGHGLVCRG